MTTNRTPALLENLAAAIREMQSAVDDSINDLLVDSPELGEVSPDFALEAALDWLDPEDFPQFGQFAGEFLDLMAKMANH